MHPIELRGVPRGPRTPRVPVQLPGGRPTALRLRAGEPGATGAPGHCQRSCGRAATGGGGSRIDCCAGHNAGEMTPCRPSAMIGSAPAAWRSSFESTDWRNRWRHCAANCVINSAPPKRRPSGPRRPPPRRWSNPTRARSDRRCAAAASPVTPAMGVPPSLRRAPNASSGLRRPNAVPIAMRD